VEVSTEMVAGTVFTVGPVVVTSTVVTTWAVMAVLAVTSVLATRRLSDDPGPVQTALEGVVLTIQSAIEAVAQHHTARVMPFIATLWVFLVTANLTGIVPGLHSPTRDLSATSALAILVFLSVHWFGIRALGLRSYLRHYLSPNPIMLPFHLLGEVSRTIALAMRLFGNMMSLEMAALLVLFVAGFLAPVPILMLHIVEALVQAYIFGMLALFYISSGLQSFEARSQRSRPNA